MSNRRMQFVCRVFIVLLVGMHVSVLQAQIDHAAIKELAREAIEKRYIGVVNPSVHILEDGVSFVLPHAKYVTVWQDDESDEKQEDLLGFPLHKQLIVEIMRKHPPDALSRRVWKPYLVQIEQLIGQAVQVINSEQKWSKKLGRLDVQIGEVYKKGQQEYARQRRRPYARSLPSIPYYDVAFKSRPGGARVWLCHALEYRLAELQGKKIPWRLVRDPGNVELAGKYAYLLQWGDKSQVGKTAINIGRSGTYFLK